MRYYLDYSIPVLQQALILWFFLSIFILPAIWWVNRRRTFQVWGPRLATVALILLYSTGVIAYTLLPLPDRATFTCPVGWGNTYPRFFLGWSLEFALRDRGSLLAALTSTYILQVLLNILLFVPFGIFAQLVWKASFRPVLLTAFGASLMIELTQLTGLWGYYGCAIRTFDAEDLFNNTLGAILGWGLVAGWSNRGELRGIVRRMLGR